MSLFVLYASAKTQLKFNILANSIISEIHFVAREMHISTVLLIEKKEGIIHSIKNRLKSLKSMGQISEDITFSPLFPFYNPVIYDSGGRKTPQLHSGGARERSEKVNWLGREFL